MRVPIIAGNWKMYKTPAEAVEFMNALKPALEPLDKIERVVVPPFVALPNIAEAAKGSPIKVGAQDVHHMDEGAYTSAIAPRMLVGLAEYVIIGHSETRQYFGVTDELVNLKIKAALKHGLKPIVALGENLDQRRAGKASIVCKHQLEAAFKDIDGSAMPEMVIAYEPIWAIGTGENASPEDAQEIIGGVLRPTLASLYGDTIAEQVRIQYGGSVKPENMANYMGIPDIDGGLVGGASLKVDSFTELIRIAREVKGLA